MSTAGFCIGGTIRKTCFTAWRTLTWPRWPSITHIDFRDAHHALEDAFVTARLWQVLLHELDRHAVKTLGACSRSAAGSGAQGCLPGYNDEMTSTIPAEIHGQRYLSLASFRKNGAAGYTPVWFAENDGKLYLMTSSKSGKYKRVRNNPKVRIAPRTMRGKITGPEFPATARIMQPDEFKRARRLINAKYWLAGIPFLWRSTDAYLEITPDAS